MTEQLHLELEALLGRLRTGHEVLPFLDRMLPVDEVRIAPLPAEMFDLLRSSSDFESIRPGEPVWMVMSAPPNAAAEIVLYRAEANGRHYVIAPTEG